MMNGKPRHPHSIAQRIPVLTVADCVSETKSVSAVDFPAIVDGAYDCAWCGQGCCGEVDMVTLDERTLLVCGHPTCDEHARIALVGDAKAVAP